MTIETVIDWAKGEAPSGMPWWQVLTLTWIGMGVMLAPLWMLLCAIERDDIRVRDAVYAFFFPVTLPVYLARALWRWVVGRRKKKAPDTVIATADVWHSGSPEWWCGPCEREVSAHEVYSGGCHGPRHRACHGPCEVHYTMRSPKPAPDLKYQGDQVTGIRKELMALEERVEKLEGKEAPGPMGYWGLGLGSAGQVYGPTGVIRKQWIAKMRNRMDAPDYHGTPEPQPARYRVWKEMDGGWRLADGIRTFYKDFYNDELWCETKVHPAVIEDWVYRNGLVEVRRDSPEYAEIVASFEAWRKGQ